MCTHPAALVKDCFCAACKTHLVGYTIMTAEEIDKAIEDLTKQLNELRSKRAELQEDNKNGQV